jgi:hypothetical protein
MDQQVLDTVMRQSRAAIRSRRREMLPASDAGCEIRNDIESRGTKPRDMRWLQRRVAWSMGLLAATEDRLKLRKPACACQAQQLQRRLSKDVLAEKAPHVGRSEFHPGAPRRAGGGCQSLLAHRRPDGSCCLLRTLEEVPEWFEKE